MSLYELSVRSRLNEALTFEDLRDVADELRREDAGYSTTLQMIITRATELERENVVRELRSDDCYYKAAGAKQSWWLVIQAAADFVELRN